MSTAAPRPRAALLAIALLAGACADGAADDPASRPNVLVIVLDTLRPDHLGLHGYERPTSPGLDAFAEECVVFENAHSSAPWTAPSLISLVTSLYPDAHAVTSYPDPGRLSDAATTLAEVLSGEGYETVAFTEGVYASAVFGLDAGFEAFHDKPQDDTPNLLEPNLARFLDWLRGRDDERPLFALFHTYEPHYPYHAPEEYVAMFRPGYDEAAEHGRRDALVADWNAGRRLDREEVSFVYHHEWHCSDDLRKIVEDVPGLFALAKEYGLNEERMLSPESQAVARDYYDAGVRFTDDRLGALWSALDEGETPLADDTIVVVVSDHGEAFGEHDLTAEHGENLHDELLRIVLLMRVPGTAPRRVPDIVRNVDVMPTLLELTGTPLDDVKHQGESLVPLLDGGSARRVAFSHAPTTDGPKRRRYSVRTDRWRLQVDQTGEHPELFDLAADPGAERDVAAEHPDEVRRLLALLEAQQAQDLALRRLFRDTARETPLTEAQLEELRAMGYVGGR